MQSEDKRHSVSLKTMFEKLLLKSELGKIENNVFTIMNLHHVLPSNTSPKVFPNNNAAVFSTPIINSYTLEGNWEVALTNFTHSNCINTFNNEVITWKKKTLSGSIQKFQLPLPTTIQEDDVIMFYINFINEKCKGILNVTSKMKRRKRLITWKVLSSNHVILLSECLRTMFKLSSNVITQQDLFPTNTEGILDINITEKSFVCIIPIIKPLKKFIIKKSKENISVAVLLQRLSLSFGEKKLTNINFDVNKNPKEINFISKDMFFIMSKEMQNVLQLRQSGFSNATLQINNFDMKATYLDELSISIYENGCQLLNDVLEENIVLQPKMFRKVEQLIFFLNEKFKDKDVLFSTKDEVVTVKVGESISLELDDVVKDVLGLPSNMLKSGTHEGDDKVSLTRHIDYFYIYSNITEYVRIGDTAAPLLAVVPFNQKSCKLLTEIKFKIPMYVKVNRKLISQIDIGIYDGNGKQIPFHRDAVSILHLHFRQQ